LPPVATKGLHKGSILSCRHWLHRLLEELRLGPPSLLTKNMTLPVGNSALVKRERDRRVQLELAAPATAASKAGVARSQIRAA